MAPEEAQEEAAGYESEFQTSIFYTFTLNFSGYARRYFVLYASGLLSYSFEKNSDIRDQIFLQTAAISSSPGRRDIHVDSGTVTFHIKCLTKQDFDLWMGALRYVNVLTIPLSSAAMLPARIMSMLILGIFCKEVHRAQRRRPGKGDNEALAQCESSRELGATCRARSSGDGEGKYRFMANRRCR